MLIARKMRKSKRVSNVLIRVAWKLLLLGVLGTSHTAAFAADLGTLAMLMFVEQGLSLLQVTKESDESARCMSHQDSGKSENEQVEANWCSRQMQPRLSQAASSLCKLEQFELETCGDIGFEDPWQIVRGQ